jgi:hypothetical protein
LSSDDPTPASHRKPVRALPGGFEADQVPRLLAFRERHPDVTITLSGFWRAIIPAENGETVVTRYELRDVLNKLDELFDGERK